MTRLCAFCVLVVLAAAACTNQSVAVQTPEPTIAPVNGPYISLATIQRVGPNAGYAAAWTGIGPVLARTLDGGATWQRIAVPVAHLTVLRFLDAKVGWAGGLIFRDMPGIACQQAPPTATAPCYGAVLHTQDGGVTWQKSLLIPYEGIYSEPVQQIQAIDGETAWALVLDCGSGLAPIGTLGCPADIRRTTDAGRTWTRLTAGYIVAMRFPTSTRGWIVVANEDGSYAIKVTNDGGSTWVPQLRTTAGQVVGLEATNSLAAWAMVQDGSTCTSSACMTYQLLSTADGGSTWTSLGNPKTTAGRSCAGGHLVGPVFVGPGSGWIAENTGAGGVRALTGLLQSVNGGKTWRCLTPPTNSELVSGADSEHLWVLTQRETYLASQIFSTDDGGVSWHTVNLAGLA